MPRKQKKHAKSTPRAAEQSTDVFENENRHSYSIFDAVESAGEFYKRSVDIPATVREMIPPGQRKPNEPAYREVPRSLWLRTAFSQWLDDFCDRFAMNSELVQRMNVCIEFAWYGQSAHPTRLAPGWLVGWPAEVEIEQLLASGERLDAAETLQVEREILARLKNARRRTHIMARVPRGRRFPSSPRMRIAMIKQKFPQASIRELCQQFDRHRIPIPHSWAIAGKTSFAEAWTDLEFRRNKVKPYISRIGPAPEK